MHRDESMLMQDSVIFNQISGGRGLDNIFSCWSATCNTTHIKQLEEASEAQDSKPSWYPQVTEGGIHLT